MTFRNYLVAAAMEICSFNRKLTIGRLGVEGLKTNSMDADLRNQAELVREETNEFNNATSILDMLDGVVDMLVTEVWLDVLNNGLVDNQRGLNIEEAIQFTLQRYRYEPLELACVQPMIMLARLGVNLQGATWSILEDNNSKFISSVQECAASVNYYRNVLGTECEARSVDWYKREWGIFRLSDLKMLKPRSYLAKREAGEGLNLLEYIPAHISNAPTLTLTTIEGTSTINTCANKRIK